MHHDGRLRVIYVSDAMQCRNGVGTYYDDLLQHLAGQLELAELIAPHATDVRAHQGLSIPIPGDATQRLYFPKRGWLRRMMSERRPAVVVIATCGPYGVRASRHARQLGIPTCVCLHTDFEKLMRLYWKGWRAQLGVALMRWAYRQVTATGSLVITYNKATARSAQHAGNPVQLVGTPVAVEFLRTPAQPLNCPPRTVLFVGRLAPEKNVPLLLRAAAELPDTRFVFAGDGPLRGELLACAQAHANVEYRGWLSRGQVLHAMDAADLLVLPSTVESFGTVALEAMARGRLVLVSPACGIRDWRPLAETLISMQPDESVTQAIRRVQALPPERLQALARQGRQAAADMTELAVRQWLELLRQLADQKNNMARPPYESSPPAALDAAVDSRPHADHIVGG